MSPLAVANSRRKQQLHLSWPDGREQWLDYALLRRQCPCSQCRAFRLQGTPPLVDARVQVVELHAQGYGLQLVFSDGHERGIYPWPYLAQLPPHAAGVDDLSAAEEVSVHLLDGDRQG